MVEKFYQIWTAVLKLSGHNFRTNLVGIDFGEKGLGQRAARVSLLQHCAPLGDALVQVPSDARAVSVRLLLSRLLQWSLRLDDLRRLRNNLRRRQPYLTAKFSS